MNLLRRTLEILGFGVTTPKGKKVRSSRRFRTFRQARARHLLFEQVEDRRVLATVSAAAMSSTVMEGSPAAVYFNVSPPSMMPITVSYQTVAGTATENVDYQGVTGSTTIYPGQNFASVGVNTLTDNVVEPAETFSVMITSVSGATVGTASATITINDYVSGSGGGGGPGAPSGVVSIAALTDHYPEGTPANFRITLSPPQPTSVSVMYQTIAGTAIENTDYTAKSGTVTIPANQSSVDVNVTTLHDFSEEQGETFSLKITSATGASVSSTQNSALATIDDVPFVLPTIAVTGGTINEGGVFTPTISVDTGTAGNVYTYSINWGDGSQATYGTSDTPSHVYVDDNPTSTASDNYTVSVTGIWPNGVPTVTGTGTVTVNNVAPEIEIQVIDPENPEIPGGVTAQGTGIRLRIALADPGVFDTHSLHIAWGDGVDDVFTVTPQQLSNGYVDVLYQYPALPASNQTQSYQIDVTVHDDDGGTATASAPVLVGTVSSGVKPVISVARIDDASEVGLVPGHFRVSRTGPTTSSLAVEVDCSGTARWYGYYGNTSDYTTPEVGSFFRTVTIPAGSDHVDITVSPSADVADEGNETVVVTIKPRPIFFGQYDISPTAGNATLNIADSYGKLTITPISDDSIAEDSNGSLGFKITSGGGIYYASLAVTGTAIGGPQWTLAAGRNGHSGVQDYFIDDGYLLSYPDLTNLSFAYSDTVKLYVYPLHDGHVEPDETVILTATSVETHPSITAPVTSNTLTLKIINDDEKQKVSVAATDATASEGANEWTVADPSTWISTDNGQFTVTRSGSTTYPLWVEYRFSGTATRGLDYMAPTASGGSDTTALSGFGTGIYIPAGSESVTITVSVRKDRVDEGDETVILTLRESADSKPVNATEATATVTIVDNDDQTIGGLWESIKQPAGFPDYFTDWKWVEASAGVDAHWQRTKVTRQYEAASPIYAATIGPGDPIHTNYFYHLSDPHEIQVGLSMVVQVNYTFTFSEASVPTSIQIRVDRDALAPDRQWGYQWQVLVVNVQEEWIFAPAPVNGQTRPYGWSSQQIDGSAGEQYVDQFISKGYGYEGANIALYGRQIN